MNRLTKPTGGDARATPEKQAGNPWTLALARTHHTNSRKFFVTEVTEEARSFTEQNKVQGSMVFAAELWVLWENKFYGERAMDAS